MTHRRDTRPVRTNRRETTVLQLDHAPYYEPSQQIQTHSATPPGGRTISNVTPVVCGTNGRSSRKVAFSPAQVRPVADSAGSGAVEEYLVSENAVHTSSRRESTPITPPPRKRKNDDDRLDSNDEWLGPSASFSGMNVSIPHDVNTSAMYQHLLPANATYTIRADATDLWVEWFEATFASIQQMACRQIAKEWIKLIHPKKQSTHPYNGRLPESRSRSPEKTKPPYWPAHVQHKEPDHIDKKERIQLLVHLIMNTPHTQVTSDIMQSKRFLAGEFLSVLRRTDNQHVKANWDTICKMIDARTQLEAFARGEHNPHHKIEIPDPNWKAQANAKPSHCATSKTFVGVTNAGSVSTFDPNHGGGDDNLPLTPCSASAEGSSQVARSQTPMQSSFMSFNATSPNAYPAGLSEANDMSSRLGLDAGSDMRPISGYSPSLVNTSSGLRGPFDQGFVMGNRQGSLWTRHGEPGDSVLPMFHTPACTVDNAHQSMAHVRNFGTSSSLYGQSNPYLQIYGQQDWAQDYNDGHSF